MKDSYAFEFGPFRCLALNDGGFAGSADLLFPEAPTAELAAALDRHGEVPDALPSPWTCLLVSSADGHCLIDTGSGVLMPGYGGRLAGLLNDAGIRPEAIDRVVLTHAHTDHIGGCLTAAGTPAFPEATHLMAQAEWDCWLGDQPASAPAGMGRVAQRVLPVLQDQLVLLSGSHEIMPGLTLIPAPGHTPGHLVVELSAGRERMLVLSDTALHPIHVEYPDWSTRLDRSAAQAAATRRTIYQRAAESGALVLAFHFAPFPGLGHIQAHGKGWRWQPQPVTG